MLAFISAGTLLMLPCDFSGIRRHVNVDLNSHELE